MRRGRMPLPGSASIVSDLQARCSSSWVSSRHLPIVRSLFKRMDRGGGKCVTCIAIKKQLNSL